MVHIILPKVIDRGIVLAILTALILVVLSSIVEHAAP